MKKNLKVLEGFETQTEQELRDVMGGKINALSILSMPVAAYAVMPAVGLLKKFFS